LPRRSKQAYRHDPVKRHAFSFFWGSAAAALLFIPLRGQCTGAEQSPPATVTNSIGMKLALVPAGEFEMGNGRRPEEEIAFFKRQIPRREIRVTPETCPRSSPDGDSL
jgi:formylglycine-generating enzyme required for sulfatase activity